VQHGVLAKESDPNLRAYVVWVPMFRGMERDVPKASTEVPDQRSFHYWDGASLLVNAYRDTLGLPEPAWDIFLLYDRSARWDGDSPPKPAYWMHQLGSARRPRVNGPFLNAATFLERTRQLIAPGSSSSAGTPLKGPLARAVSLGS
jgi:hypothetical protein